MLRILFESGSQRNLLASHNPDIIWRVLPRRPLAARLWHRDVGISMSDTTSPVKKCRDPQDAILESVEDAVSYKAITFVGAEVHYGVSPINRGWREEGGS